MATLIDVKDALISQFNDVLTAITSIDNLEDIISNGRKTYILKVNIKDINGTALTRNNHATITINDNGNTSDSNQYTIKMTSSVRTTNDGLYYEAPISSAEFSPLETDFLTKINTFRSVPYDNSIIAINRIGINMKNNV